jgi:hypothetical protein
MLALLALGGRFAPALCSLRSRSWLYARCARAPTRAPPQAAPSAAQRHRARRRRIEREAQPSTEREAQPSTEREAQRAYWQPVVRLC